MPAVFRCLQELGGVELAEMRRVFNMGIGMALVVSEFYAASVASQITDQGITCRQIGKITTGSGTVQYTDG